MQLHEHRCSYCDHDHAISSKEIRTAWAFVKCEACGKLSILKGSGAREPAIARPASSAIPKPPPFLTTPPPAEKKPRAQAPAAAAPVASARAIPAPIPPGSEAPSRRRTELWSRIRQTVRERRGPIYAGILIIAIGLLILSAQRLRGQAERLAELSLVPEINPTAAPAMATPPPALAPRAQAAAPAPADVTPADVTPAAAPAPALAPAPNAMAAPPPDAVRTSSAEPARPFQIEIAKEAVLLRSGPGTNYRKVGAADLGARLPVLEWRGDWFRVGLNPDGGTQATTAWVRNDLVRRVE